MASSEFRINIYRNIVRSGVSYPLADWTSYVEGLRWSTNAFGGYGSCSFRLKRNPEWLFEILEGAAFEDSYITNRIRITDSSGFVCYEGLIWTLSLPSWALSRSADALWNIALTTYSVPYKNDVKHKTSYYADADSRASFGNKVYRMELGGSFAAADTTPTKQSRRWVEQHRMPGKSDARSLGGDRGGELELVVDCVGLASTLDWRYAFNNDAKSFDSSQIVKDMLRPGTVADGGNGAGVGRNNWVERLTASGNTIAFGQQFISGTDFSKIEQSGVTIPANMFQGDTRLNICKACANLGSSDYKRMLFQVWAFEDANIGLGKPWFFKQVTALQHQAGWNGYEDNPLTGQVWNSKGNRIPLWRVRGGNWIFSRGVALPRPLPSGATAYDDARIFWIEEAEYDVDSATLTLTSSADWNAEQYLGRLIGGKRIIKEQF